MQRLLRRIANSKKSMCSFKLISHIGSVILSCVFLLQLLLLVLEREYFLALKVAVSAGVGYLFVTVIRRLINAPRPYELRDYYREIPKNKSGESFPSRHAYSAFVIAVLAWLISPVLSMACAAIAVCICAARVFTGIHFLRDVVCGAAIGILAGAIGVMIVF